MTGYRVPGLALGASVEADTEVARSRFRCRVTRVEDEGAAREAIGTSRRDHPDARHHCSALVLGADRAVERASDDGEPSGTAGAPMLEVLRGSEVCDVVAVVSRWFGGTLLGTGGLVRAYGDGVRAGLALAGVRHRSLLVELEVVLDHAEAARVETELRARGVPVLDVGYAAAVTLRVGAEPAGVGDLHALVAGLTAGAARARPVGERWVDGPALP